MELIGTTVSDVWSKTMAVFEGTTPRRAAYRHGVAFDIPGVTLWVEDLENQAIPQGYAYPELVFDYGERLFGAQRESSLFFQRLSSAAGKDDTIDQTESMYLLLSADPHSRSAIFSVWLPGDTESEFPVSPVGGAFRIVGSSLVLFLTARSSDVWVGLVPELLTFARYATNMARRLGVAKAVLCYHTWSAHIHETDLLTYTKSLTG